MEVRLEEILYDKRNILKSFLEEYWSEIDPDYEKTRKFLDKYVEYLFNTHNRRICWIQEKDERVGLIVYYFYNTLGFSEQSLHVSEFFIRKEFRRRGFGRKVIKILCSSWPIYEIRLEALKSNETGVFFWKEMGFEPWKYIMKKSMRKG